MIKIGVLLNRFCVLWCSERQQAPRLVPHPGPRGSGPLSSPSGKIGEKRSGRGRWRERLKRLWLRKQSAGAACRDEVIAPRPFLGTLTSPGDRALTSLATDATFKGEIIQLEKCFHAAKVFATFYSLFTNYQTPASSRTKHKKKQTAHLGCRSLIPSHTPFSASPP